MQKELIVLDRMPSFIRVNQKYDKPFVFFMFPKDQPDGIEKVLAENKENLEITSFVNMRSLSEGLQKQIRDELTAAENDKQLGLFKENK